ISLQVVLTLISGVGSEILTNSAFMIPKHPVSTNNYMDLMEYRQATLIRYAQQIYPIVASLNG
ncbi:MAG: hypothetical protein ACKN87_01680, partial [Microcystis aeruginosa]